MNTEFPSQLSDKGSRSAKTLENISSRILLFRKQILIAFRQGKELISTPDVDPPHVVVVHEMTREAKLLCKFPSA